MKKDFFKDNNMKEKNKKDNLSQFDLDVYACTVNRNLPTRERQDKARNFAPKKRWRTPEKGCSKWGCLSL